MLMSHLFSDEILDFRKKREKNGRKYCGNKKNAYLCTRKTEMGKSYTASSL